MTPGPFDWLLAFVPSLVIVAGIVALVFYNYRRGNLIRRQNAEYIAAQLANARRQTELLERIADALEKQ